jgi:hypothetical protein
MDWFVLLTPILLLPIIFLFRLIGCELDTTGGLALSKERGKRIFFSNANTIPPIQPNPIRTIEVRFEITPTTISPFTANPDPGESIHEASSGSELTPDEARFEKGLLASLEKSENVTYVCHCKIIRYGSSSFDVPLQSEPLETTDSTIICELKYKATDPPSVYSPSSFEIFFANS